MDVDGGNTNSHTLTGLINGQTYTISIVGTSSSVGLPREPVSAGTVDLGKIANLSTCFFYLYEYSDVVFPTFCCVTHNTFVL